MLFQVIQPTSVLAPYVKHYWAMKSHVKPGNKHVQRIIPNGFVELTFYLDHIPVYNRNSKMIRNRVVVSGQQNDFYDIIITNNLNLFSIVFKPQGSKLFLGLPIQELYNQSIPAEILFKNEIYFLHEKLQETTNLNMKVQLVESFLIEQIKQSKLYEFERLNDSIKLINSSKGILTIDKLSSKAYLSKKQFERTFRSNIGIAPKRFLRVVRFQNTLFNKQLNPKQNLTELAYQNGFYDQSHMINEFKDLTGLTPKQYFSDCAPYSDYFS